MKPEVTAVITTHARPHHVREALASLRAELHEDRECLVVEDGSTLEEDSLADVLPGVRLHQGDRLGIARARNMGLEAARGEFIIFLDDDDVALPSRISTLIEAVRRHDADLCYGLTRRIFEEGHSVHPDVPTYQVSSGPVGLCDLLTCTPHVNAVLVRTEALRAVGGFDVLAEHFDDWAAWLSLADRNIRMWCVPEVVAEWRVHPAGLSGLVARARAMRTRLLAMFDRLIPRVSAASADALAIARRVVLERDMVTYDDYAEAMQCVRESMHGTGTCLGARLAFHAG
jgi:O-antigen biosynthesis protein